MQRSDEALRLAYVCQGGGGLGWGHVGRGYAVLQAAGGASTLVVGQGYQEVAAWIRRTERGIKVASWAGAAVPFAHATGRYDVVIVDDYGVESTWISHLSQSCPVVVLDDWQRSALTATALLNPNLDASDSDYPAVRVQHAYFGPQFALLRREVVDISERKASRQQVRRVLLTFGGSDPAGYTAEAATVIRSSKWWSTGREFTVVLGRGYSGDEPWKAWLGRKNLEVQILQDPNDFLSRCWEADLVVSGSGTSTYELAYLGTPFIPVAIVENQQRIVDAWARRGVGAGVTVRNMNWRDLLRAEFDTVCVDRSRVEQMVSAGRREVDGRGVSRLLGICRELCEVSA